MIEIVFPPDFVPPFGNWNCAAVLTYAQFYLPCSVILWTNSFEVLHNVFEFWQF